MPVSSISRLKQCLLSLPRWQKQALAMTGDIAAAWLALWLALSLRLDVWHVPTVRELWIWIAAPAIFVPVFIRFGLYRAIFRYTGLATMQTVLKAVGVYGVILFILVFATFPAGVPRSIGLLQPLLFLMLVSNLRVWALFWLNKGNHRAFSRRLLIYGAGSAGAQTATAMANGGEFELLGFIDDDPSKVGRQINGVLVFRPADAVRDAERLGVTDILLALPSATRHRRNEIVASLRGLPIHVRSVPAMSDVASGRVSMSDFQELDVEDLLGREPVAPNPALLARDLAGKVVLVTGAGGSIGSELCRQILKEHPARLLLLEHNEFALYSIHLELSTVVAGGLPAALSADGPPTLVPLLASVRDYRRLSDIFRAYSPDTVYHAAAYKHVPMVEHNLCEGIANNTLGTLHVARVAIECGTASFVLVSTDKAVRPTNVMGASKRLAELILQGLSSTTMARFDHVAPLTALARNRTRFSIVRFGNVLGSSGSVVPLFRQQVRAGGPVTVTHADVTRFFMTISEAAQLVLQAGAMAEGGEVFVLDMGQPVKVMDLAQRVVELCGLTVRDVDHPDGDIELVVTGLRPGEKLFEELLIGDNPSATAHARIWKARESFFAWEELRPRLIALEQAVFSNDVAAVNEILVDLVSGYQTPESVVDWIAVAQDSAPGAVAVMASSMTSTP